MSERVCAVVLAGGLGTRLRAALPDLPKPMAPVAGRPFIEWVLRYLAKQGIAEAVISTGYRAEVFTEHFAQKAVPGLDRVQCVAEPEPMGTAGGFLFAAGSISPRPEAWLVLNGDSLAVADLAPLCDCLADPDCDGAVLAIWMDEASRYGSLEITPDGWLVGFREKRPGASWINAGVYLIRDRLLADFSAKRPLSWETDVFPGLLSSGRKLRVAQAKAPFLDIGLPETLAAAGDFIHASSGAFA